MAQLALECKPLTECCDLPSITVIRQFSTLLLDSARLIFDSTKVPALTASTPSPPYRPTRRPERSYQRTTTLRRTTLSSTPASELGKLPEPLTRTSLRLLVRALSLLLLNRRVELGLSALGNWESVSSFCLRDFPLFIEKFVFLFPLPGTAKPC